MGDTTPFSNELNRAGRRAEARKARIRKAGAALATVPAALGTTALVLGATAGPAGALPLLVTNLDPTGAGSLRDVAEGAANGDVITFQAGLTGTIYLDDEINIDTSIVIEGPGAGVVTVSGDSGNNGSDNVRIFNVNGPGPSDRIDVTISGLTLTHGAGNFGGAVLFDDANLTIRDAIITDNTATGSGGGGIATDDQDEDLVIETSEITGNSADGNGGGIYFYSSDGGTFTMTGSTVSNNTADGDGGGVWIKGENSNTLGAVSITGSTISGNTAEDGDGGGLFAYYIASASISGTTISGNTATYGGGGMWMRYVDGNVDIADSTITGNLINGEGSYNGGGLYVSYVFGNLAISGTTISGNTATGGGGGAHIYYIDGNADITGSTISGNSADDDGGGLYITAVHADTTIAFSTIAGNRVGPDSSDTGGGVMINGNGDDESQGERMVIRNSTISGNSAAGDGGGLYISNANYAPVEIYNSTISGNTAGGEGGGIAFNSYYGLTIVQSTIADNHATTFGGIYIGANEEQAVVSSDKDAANAEARARREAEKNAERVAEGKDPVVSTKVKAKDGVRAAAVTPDLVTLTGTIVATNSGTDIGDAGTVTASGSIIGTISGTTFVDQGGNQLGVDPLLGPLQNNGGPTETQELLPGSPAINAGPNPLVPFPGSDFDQRGDGYARVIAGVVDVGAYEVQPVQLEPNFTG